MKKIKLLWILLIMFGVGYEMYLYILISYFEYDSHYLKPEFAKLVILHSILMFPSGIIFVLIFIVFGITINSWIISKILLVSCLILNYYILFIYLPKIWKK